MPTLFGAVVAVIALSAPLESGASEPQRPPTAQISSTYPSGRYTLLSGQDQDLSALRGTRVLVWFVEAGCASCSVSIPAVANKLTAFSKSRTHVLVLGLYGAFGQGGKGRAALGQFARATAGNAVSNPAWTWGLASEGLTVRFDPTGIPDAYYLLSPAGAVTYQGSVPISTLGSLLERVTGSARA